MNKKISLGAAIAFMAIVAMATLAITMARSKQMFNTTVHDLNQREKRYSRIAEVDDLIRQNYMGTIDQEVLLGSVIEGFVRGIGDPYAEYYNATQYARLLDEMNNKSVQIGINTRMDESGYIEVTEVYPNSPALAARIEPGDLIVKIDDLDITTENYVQAVNQLSGEPGTKMAIVVRKGTVESTLDMTRRFVEVPSVWSEMLEGNIGLVRFSEFNDNTPAQFIKQVDNMMDDGAVGFVFDVRGVSSATLRSVAQVLDKLMPVGALVSSTDKNGTTTVLETSDAREVSLPMAVLMNEKTIGEAELFGAVVRDFDKGKLIGVKTAGKGTVQRIIPLSDNSGAVKLTVARYSSPKSPSFHGEGVKPDYEVSMTPDQLRLMEALGNESDLQLKKAIEIVLTGTKSGTSLAENVSSVADPSSDAASSAPEDSSASASSSDEDSSEEEQAASDGASGEEASSSDTADSEDAQETSSQE